MTYQLTVMLLLLFSSFIGWTQDSKELNNIALDIEQRRYQLSANREQTISELSALAKRISILIENGKLAPPEMAAAYYYRAIAWTQINSLHYLDGKRMDEALARQVLTDLDKLIAGGIEYPPLGVRTSEELYVAGSVAIMQLHSESLAFSYWRKCAALDHAGCLNIMANATLTGAGKQKVDFQEAINYHLKVFNTGTKYHCAGAYSAQSIASIGYFTGTATPQGDELFWIERALDLTDQMASEDKGQKPCVRSNMLIDEFLYRLARGDRQDALLYDASTQPELDPNSTQAVVGFISGQLTPRGFSSAVALAKNDVAKCSAYFSAIWYAELTNRHALARQYYQDMLNVHVPNCDIEILYARKFKFSPQAKSR